MRVTALPLILLAASLAAVAQQPPKTDPPAPEQAKAADVAKPAAPKPQPPPAPKVEPPPVVPDSIQAAFFKAKADAQDAQAAQQAAQQEVQTAVADATRACGDKFITQLDQNPGPRHNYLVCLPKPVPATPPPAAPAK